MSRFAVRKVFPSVNYLFAKSLGNFQHGSTPRPIERRLDWVFYKTEMKIWAVGELLPRIHHLCHYNQFSWNATGSPSIEPDLSPQWSLILFSPVFGQIVKKENILSLYDSKYDDIVRWLDDLTIFWCFFAKFKQVLSEVLKIIGVYCLFHCIFEILNY